MAARHISRLADGRGGRLTALVALVLAIALVAGPATALAQQGPTADQYDAAPERIQEAVAAGDAAPAEAAPADGTEARVVAALPFTGLDLMVLAGAAALLAIAGFGLRSLSRPSPDRR